MNSLRDADPVVHSLIRRELQRQREGAEMIPSENLVSLPVLETMGSVLTNKYSEGLPRKRYYGGNEVIDEIEELAIERARKLFHAEHVNVQPYSGSPANHAVYLALLDIGDVFMGMRLDQGGHLTHGHQVNFSGIQYNPVLYADIVTTTTHKTLRGPRGAMILCKEEFAKKVDKAIFPGLQGGPHNHTTAGIAVCLGEALKPEFRAYAQQVVANARALAAGLQKENIRPVSGGTETHLVLADLTARNVAGKAAETALDRAAIYVNKNTIPYDTRSPWDPSGIRLGSPP